MQTVAETPIFIRRAESLLSEEEHFDLITYLATHPTVGDEIVGREAWARSDTARWVEANPAVFE